MESGAVGGELRLTRFQIIEATTCGVFLASLDPRYALPTYVSLERGVVALSDIGVCVQVEGYNLEELQNAVQYRDNGTNLDITTLPVPPPLNAFPG